MANLTPYALALSIVLAAPATAVGAVSRDFESLNDLDALTTQFAGLTFSNTTALTAGLSLNDLDFPPRSGINVVGDDGGAITIDFATPVLSFEGFFTYIESMSLTAFDATLAEVASATSAFSSNAALGGEVGSSPNELLSVGAAGGIRRIVISGNAAGGSFVMDDITYEFKSGEPVPASSTLTLLTAALVGCRLISRSGRSSMRTGKAL